MATYPTNGLTLDQAIEQARTWVAAQDVPGLTMQVIKTPGKTPVLFFDIPATGGLDGANTALLYTRGLAYLQQKQGPQAVQEFRRVIDSRSVTVDPLASFAKLGMARGFALQGDKANSRIAYQDFLALWKDADPNIPLLKQAKAEYAAVK